MRKNNTNYFSHDCNARNDERIMQLRAEHGRKGYGMFFAIVEVLSESSTGKCALKSLPGITMLYQFDNDVITMLFDIGLLEKDDEYFWSPSLLRRLELKEEKKEKI